MKLFVLLLLAIFVLAKAAHIDYDFKDNNNKDNKIRYDNFTVYKLKLNNEKQREIVLKLTKNYQRYSMWRDIKNELTLMVNPDELFRFRNLTQLEGIETELWIENVQQLIDEEEETAVPITNAKSANNFNWKRYHNLETIYEWLDAILAAYPRVTEGFEIGKSYEGRPIRGIKISYKSRNPGIFIESNIHAREWITSATATWLINELLTSNDDIVRDLAEQHDWYIIPVLNVDGFVYTHVKDRMWRKTRQPVEHSSCIGTDPNRNYNSHWMENGGASDDPCAENYAGPYAHSEPEIKAMTEYIASIKNKLNIMLAFHSYSQLLLSPYGHTDKEQPPNYKDLMSVAKAYATAVQRMPYGTVYRYGTSAQILYTASGATNDWAYNEQDIKISYTIEFRDTGHYGFVLPPIQIIPNAEETLAGILGLVREAKKLGYLSVKY